MPSASSPLSSVASSGPHDEGVSRRVTKRRRSSSGGALEGRAPITAISPKTSQSDDAPSGLGPKRARTRFAAYIGEQVAVKPADSDEPWTGVVSSLFISPKFRTSLCNCFPFAVGLLCPSISFAVGLLCPSISVLNALKMLSLPSEVRPIANANLDFRVQMAKSALHASQGSTRTRQDRHSAQVAQMARVQHKRVCRLLRADVCRVQQASMVVIVSIVLSELTKV